jgi:pyruvate/2-oxoglutarate dehydrogenase complex dihydrolipoamide dehydrogenase (E3) component
MPLSPRELCDGGTASVAGRDSALFDRKHVGLAAGGQALPRPATTALSEQVSPICSFTDPEYASVGMTEAAAEESREVVGATVGFDRLSRPLVDGRGEASPCPVFVSAYANARAARRLPR